MANIFTSSIGKKLIMSVTGLFLIIFLLLHATINSFAIVDAINGTWGQTAHNLSDPQGLFSLGCNFMATPVVTIMVPVLALGFIFHIIYACYLTWSNIKTRGGYNRYEVSSKAKTESWASKNMFALGIIVLGFIALHLSHFWADMQLQMFTGGEEENPYTLLTRTFGNPIILVGYIIWFGALWFHLTHGFWSAFQTVGWSNQIWMKRLNVIGVIFATLVCLMFVAVAITSFIMA